MDQDSARGEEREEYDDNLFRKQFSKKGQTILRPTESIICMSRRWSIFSHAVQGNIYPSFSVIENGMHRLFILPQQQQKTF
jgi:hypothetical protein